MLYTIAVILLSGHQGDEKRDHRERQGYRIAPPSARKPTRSVNRVCHFEQPCRCATREPYALPT